MAGPRPSTSSVSPDLTVLAAGVAEEEAPSAVAGEAVLPKLAVTAAGTEAVTAAAAVVMGGQAAAMVAAEWSVIIAADRVI
ncbi:hypothetical protein LOK49_LG08G01657 [Camellia lanceoleosa]|uniref:Uncharacterized protein n=1 Tax=Camellia lanceoleosa TaxID=1840588 RepID=A0ACC0GQ06_9ERIC|nr:hypothetical protein LOK49_LG08G01657 [Camellia lanceoleosa]